MALKMSLMRTRWATIVTRLSLHAPTESLVTRLSLTQKQASTQGSLLLLLSAGSLLTLEALLQASTPPSNRPATLTTASQREGAGVSCDQRKLQSL